MYFIFQPVNLKYLYRDILSNSDVKLDDMFIASLVGDIVRGMTYIQGLCAAHDARCAVGFLRYVPRAH